LPRLPNKFSPLLVRHIGYSPLAMNWGHIAWEVLAFYFKLMFVYLAYLVSKIYIAQHRPARNPPFTKRIGGYLRCIAAVMFLTLLVFAYGDEDDHPHSSISGNYYATICLILLIPALYGATEGFSTDEKFPVSHSDNDM